MSKTNLLNSIKLTKPGKNRFDLTHDVKMSLNPGLLYPTLALECVPGDSFKIGCESIFRLAPLVAPMMHRVDVTMHYFFVPNRLVWENWENYITNTEVGGTLPAFPYFGFNNVTNTPLCDYFGLPTPLNANDQNISAMPFSMYQLIYNEFYRDQNLIDEIDFMLLDGDNTANSELFDMRRRAWEHDYFTSALPFAQKGAAVEIPVVANFEDVNVYLNDAFGTTLTATPANILVGGKPSTEVPDDTLYADTSELDVESTTINDLRVAFRLQEWLEKSARGGSRYSENILSFFGVKAQDFRLNRPEYITGTKSPVVISEVLNTTGTVDAPQGEMAGHGVSVTSGKYGNYYCMEHGYIIGICSIMPKPAYQQGIPKHFLKINDPFEFFWPQFAHVGEQEVQNMEIYFSGNAVTDQAVFGYLPRYIEYKYINNRVSGDFRTSLNFWHWGRIFASVPGLNQAFIECDPDYRVFAVTDPGVDHFYAQILHNIQAVRPMPKFGTPTF